ncbi:hypothetical protein ABEY82_14995 [Priestia megaterium]
MNFNSEADLVQYFLKTKSNSSKTRIITELETNFGRPDIVIIQYNQWKYGERKNNMYDINFTRKHSYILSFLFKKGWVSIGKLQQFFSLNEKEIKNILLQMNSMNLVDLKGNLVKSKPAKELLVIKNIQVYEAKLANWKYVIEQAERHLWFTNESSILLPELSSNVLNKCMEKCKEVGIGMSIIEKNKIKNLLKPLEKKIINTPLLWELNERLLKGDI